MSPPPKRRVLDEETNLAVPGKEKTNEEFGARKVYRLFHGMQGPE